jgi:AcrR family transcriptional regulator
MQSSGPQAPQAQTRVRRTQRERRESTRSRLLDATIESLVELGYSGTTTLEIERRAGVSRGARIHHYPTKASLLADAVDHLYLQLSAHYEEAFGRVPGGAEALGQSDADRLRTGLMLIWSVYRQRNYTAVLELNMAARTDAELRARLIEVGNHHRRLAVEAATNYFALPAASALRVVEAIHAVLMGLLMQRNVDCDERRERDVIEALQDMVIPHLPGMTSSQPPFA